MGIGSYMLKISVGLIGAFILLATGVAMSGDLADLVVRVKPAVVGVGTVQRLRQPPASLRGTGFVVAGGRHIVTNAHVIPDFLDSENFEYLAVFSGNGEKPDIRQGRRVAADAVHDLALLEIGGKPLPALPLGMMRDVREGMKIAFTGFPIGMVLGLYPATHQGIVSAITPIAVPANGSGSLDAKAIKMLRNRYPVFQLDATAYPGNSGSPVYGQESGEVIGVINKVFVQEGKEYAIERPSGISYAIPVKHVRALLRKAGFKDY